MPEYQFERNPSFRNLPVIGVGDMVHLRFTDTFPYLAQAIVSEINSNMVSAEVRAIFDGTGEGLVNNSEVNVLVGSVQTFSKELVHRVINRD